MSDLHFCGYKRTPDMPDCALPGEFAVFSGQHPYYACWLHLPDVVREQADIRAVTVQWGGTEYQNSKERR